MENFRWPEQSAFIFWIPKWDPSSRVGREREGRQEKRLPFSTLTHPREPFSPQKKTEARKHLPSLFEIGSPSDLTKPRMNRLPWYHFSPNSPESLPADDSDELSDPLASHKSWALTLYKVDK